MKKIKRIIALFLTVCMIASTPLSAMAAETVAPQSEETFCKVLHLDNGRKYFSKDWIIALINEMEAAGYNQLQLAFGNDGLRFLLDDMSVTVDGTTYSSENVTAGIKAGNEAYYDAGDVNELTQSEMTEIVTYAKNKGIEVVPHMNMPGHMDAILDAIEYVGIADAHFEGTVTSATSLNLENDAAVKFTHALLEKYVAYFDSLGCQYFHIGADEYGNDAYGGSMGFPSMGSSLYTKFATFVNDAAAIVKAAGMTPRAWNDGISYTKYSDEFDTSIQITYWSSGWTEYDVASASTLSSNGHGMINTNGDYYYVLGKNDCWTTGSSTTHDADLYTEASGWSNTAFMGSTVENPIGSMFCIWCDYPGAETETQVAANVRLVLRAMAAEMQGNDASTISTEVVSGGFNEDGSIAATREWKTVTDSDSTVQVSGYELTSVTADEVAEADLPSIEGVAKTKAWDITPYVGDAKYTENGTVSLPVPTDWNASMLKGFYVENGEAVLVEGTFADGKYTFDMPHFSVAGIAELDYDELIELNVGESKKVTDSTGNYESSYTGEGLDTSIATVEVEGKSAVTDTTVSQTTATELEAGATYVLRVYNTTYALSANTGRGDWGTNTLAFESNTLTANTEHLWTLEASGSGYKLKNAEGYLNLGTGNNTAYLDDTGEVFTITSTSSGWTIGNQSGRYINALGGLTTYYTAGGWTADDTRFDLYKVTESTAASTDITFTGMKVGETAVTIGNTIYKVVVSKGTINSTITVDTFKTYTDSSSNVTVADPSIATAILENGILTITGVGEGTTTITTDNAVYTITVTSFDLSAVEPLVVEYWITNGPITDSATGLTNVEISASSEGVYSAEGIALADIVPETLTRENRETEYWQAKLLDVTQTNDSTSGTQEQTVYVGDDETLVDTTFTHVRYWNGVWQVLVGEEWIDVDRTEVTVNTYSNDTLTGTATREKHQLVAYYMEIIDIQNNNGTTELHVNAADWGFKSGDEWGYGTSDFDPCTVTVQIVYEDGTINPSNEVADLLTKTLVYGYWEGGRGLGTMIFDGGDNYNIYKVTAETGDAGFTNNYNGFTINTLSWDGNEETVWQDDPSQSVSIGNPARNPSYEEPKDNLTWNTDEHNQNNAILVRVYVKAVEKEDTLNVVYYDEKFGDTLYEYNINVKTGDNFNDNILNLETGNIQDPGEFKDDATRIDVTGYGIKNALDVTQKFQTNLTLVPEAVGKYNSELYKYTGSKISEDGKTLYLYYNINTEVLSPNYVADFGLPLEFGLEELLGDNTSVDAVDEVGALSARYGTLTYDEGTHKFTYTPTQIMQNIDVLSINLTIAGESTTTNVGVTPATTVHYEESFINYDSNWTVSNAPTKLQKTEVLGKSSYYGYDVSYAEDSAGSNGTFAESKATGAAANFTFTGSGFELYANSKPASGFVTVYSQGELSKLYMIDTKLTDIKGKEIEGSTYYSLPVISETDLPHGTYSVQIKQTNGDKPVYIDGVRVVNTIDETGKAAEDSIYYADKEDKPVFYELRDYVLNAIGVEDLTESDYIASGDRDSMVKAVQDMAGQVYNALGDGTKAVIIDNGTTFGNDQAQNLLDNGPKNEVYLYEDQTLVFSVETNRIMQLGLKAPTGSANFEITVDENKLDLNSLTTTVDMFYKIAEKSDDAQQNHKVSITVTDGVLSVTDLKICDDPTATFNEITQKDIEDVLLGIYGLGEEPGNPETPVEPEPGTPEAPVDPAPGVTDEPTQEPEHECTMTEEIIPATTMKAGKIVNKCKECGEVESTKIIYKASNVKLGQATFVYNGKQKNPKVIVKDSKGNVINAKYYKVTKPKGRTNVGKYTYTIKFNGLYKGTKKLTLTVKPKATAIKKVTASKKAFTVKWSKVSKQATGYEIMYATNAKFTKGKHIVKVKNFKTTSKKISNLKAKQKYYVKVRTYKTVKVNGKMIKIYSNWSKYKTVTTKR